MKPVTPHDPLDDLFAAALHGDLTPDERTQLESQLRNDPAAQAAYLEAQAMHDLLEKTHRTAQPDSAFEQRMVSGVRRKLQHEPHQETAWESLLILWRGMTSIFGQRWLWMYGGVCSVVLLLAFSFVVWSGSRVRGVFTTITSQLAVAGATNASPADDDALKDSARDTRHRSVSFPDGVYQSIQQNKVDEAARDRGLNSIADANGVILSKNVDRNDVQQFGGRPSNFPGLLEKAPTSATIFAMPAAAPAANLAVAAASFPSTPSKLSNLDAQKAKSDRPASNPITNSATDDTTPDATPPLATPSDLRKLIRNAQLDLEVKSFQSAMDQIAALTKEAGGYIDTSNSQKGGNGKLQGTVVVKVLPQNLDDFLLKLRDLGQVQNQSVSTDDVTKDYFDTQARLDNSRRMETQLQDLLKRENGKVADLLAVERELGRVRGEIEQMQGQLKLYDFQVQYATVTMQLHEKDLNQAAAYLLKEQDDFSLFATDVEGTFQKARSAADDFKAQVLTANLNHNSGSDVSAELVVMVAPDQIESFLGKVRDLGRVANFTRQTQRVARDGGQSDQPADQTLTEKDKVQVHLAIRSDDESRKQVALTVVAKAVDVALDQAKTAALANAGVEILSSALNKTPQGQSTAQLTVRVPGQDYATLIAAFNALGRSASLSIQRNDNSGPGANGDDAPVIVSLSLTDDDTPVQETQMAVLASDVDAQAQEIKKAAAAAGVEVKASSFERQPDGTELAQMTFRLPMGVYPTFVESVKKLGKVESLSVHRDDRPDQTRADDTAPVEIALQLHNQRDIVADDSGLWATLRRTFGEGAGALFGSIRVIGVLVAFITPWIVTLILLAWIGRRIYVWRRNK
jgi:Domain of unknown function (DUF4349)